MYFNPLTHFVIVLLENEAVELKYYTCTTYISNLIILLKGCFILTFFEMP